MAGNKEDGPRVCALLRTREVLAGLEKSAVASEQFAETEAEKLDTGDEGFVAQSSYLSGYRLAWEQAARLAKLVLSQVDAEIEVARILQKLGVGK